MFPIWIDPEWGGVTQLPSRTLDAGPALGPGFTIHWARRCLGIRFSTVPPTLQPLPPPGDLSVRPQL